jgi:hypothetical protein
VQRITTDTLPVDTPVDWATAACRAEILNALNTWEHVFTLY